MSDVAELINAETNVPLELHHAIEQFLYREAELLDDKQFRDWLTMMSDDIRYTSPYGWQVCRREITLDQATLTSHNLSVFF
jgi:3-phenylpropionate/cinnamic acid dioxygenase small subunit